MNPLLQALLATLPLLGLGLGAKGGFLHGAIGGGIFLLSTLIFLGLRPALPRAVHRVIFFLLIFALGVGLGKVFFLSSLLLVSLFVLSLPEYFQSRKRAGGLFQKALALSFFFWAFLAGHGIFFEFLGERLGMGFFAGPSGSYFLLGLFFLLFGKR